MGIWNIFIYTYSLTIKFLQHSQDCNESFIKYKKLLNTYTGQLRHFRINSISEINISSLHKWKKCLKPILCTVWSGLHTRKYSISSMISCFHLAVRHFIIVVWDISWLDEWLKYVDLVHESQEVFFEMCSWSNLKQEKIFTRKKRVFHQLCSERNAPDLLQWSSSWSVVCYFRYMVTMARNILFTVLQNFIFEWVVVDHFRKL